MSDPQRSKAAAMFGKTFMDAAKPTPPAKNYATAQQKVANSRPIPTYKVGGPVKKAMGGEAKAFDEAVAAMPSPVMRAVGGAGKTRKGQAPIKRAQGGPVKDGSPKDAEYGDYVAAEKDREPKKPAPKPVKKAAGGVGKMRHGVPMKKAEGGGVKAESVSFERTPSTISRNITPPEPSFGEAFKAARGSGLKTFTWKGKSYTTELAGENRSSPKPAPRAASVSSPSKSAPPAEPPRSPAITPSRSSAVSETKKPTSLRAAMAEVARAQQEKIARDDAARKKSIEAQRAFASRVGEAVKRAVSGRGSTQAAIDRLGSK